MEATLEAVKRDQFGKNAARRLRSANRVPAVFYGGASDEAGRPVALPVTVDPKEFMRILHSDSGANTLITLKLAGQADERVMIKEYQLDPVTHDPLHADLYRIALDKRLTVTVPVVLKGEAPGVKLQGGVVDFVNRQVDIECLPTEIPEHIEVDISGLMLGQGVRLREVAETARWIAKTDLEVMLVHVVALKVAAEPEVIKKGKGEKEGEKGEKEE